MKKFMKKFLAGSVVALFALSMTAGASALTVSELMVLIPGLTTAQYQAIAALSGSTTSTSTSASAYTHTMTLKSGMSGAKVMELQRALTSLGFTTGADGSFGPATASKVMAFQTSKGLTPDGIVGTITGARLQTATMTTTTTTNNNNNNNGGGIDLETFAVGGDEATLDDYNVNNLDSDPMEGENDVEIFNADVKWDDSDVLNERIDFLFVPTGVNQVNEEPSEVFESLTLEIDGEEVASIDNADDSDEYQDSTYNFNDADDVTNAPTSGDLYSVRFSGLRFIAEEGEEYTISLKADMQSSQETATDSWAVVIPVDGGRVTDRAALVSTFGTDTEFDSFDLDSEGIDNKFTVREGDNNPEASVLKVEDSSKSDEHTVLIAEVDVDDNSEDLEIQELEVTVNTGTANYDVIVDTFTLKVGNVEIEGDAGTPGTSTTVNFDFDANELVINSGDMEDFEFVMEFNATGTYLDGETVSVDFDADDMNAKGDDSNEAVTDKNGSLTGDTHELREEGIMIDVVSATTTVTTDDGVVGTNPDVVEFNWVLEIDATDVDSDVYVNADAVDIVTSSTALDVDVLYTLESSTANSTAAPSGTVSESDSDVSTVTGAAGYTNTPYNGESFMKINSGSKGTITINISALNATDAKQVRAYLSTIEWTTDLVESAVPTGASTINSYTFDLADDTKTPFKFVN